VGFCEYCNELGNDGGFEITYFLELQSIIQVYNKPFLISTRIHDAMLQKAVLFIVMVPCNLLFVVQT
jgi:hypothetical protein